MRQRSSIVFLLIALMLSGCAGKPVLDSAGVNPKLTPSDVAQQQNNAVGQKIMWGGSILASINLKSMTQFEILAFPTDKRGQPDINVKPIGRFLIQHPGYLETADYNQGRHVTVVGSIKRVQTSKLGEANYTYPVITAEQLHLWPRASQANTDSRIHFGFGFIFH